MSECVVRIARITRFEPAVAIALERLYRQLLAKDVHVDRLALEGFLSGDSRVLLLATDRETDGAIVGAITVVFAPLTTGPRAWFDDLVVDEMWRRQGVGEALFREAIEVSRAFGARTIQFTSNPKRLAAHRLFKRFGFTQRETDVFELRLPAKENV